MLAWAEFFCRMTEHLVCHFLSLLSKNSVSICSHRIFAGFATIPNESSNPFALFPEVRCFSPYSDSVSVCVELQSITILVRQNVERALLEWFWESSSNELTERMNNDDNASYLTENTLTKLCGHFNSASNQIFVREKRKKRKECAAL